jgi:hypothetical protein
MLQCKNTLLGGIDDICPKWPISAAPVDLNGLGQDR